MRLLSALALLVAVTAVSTAPLPTAAACHPDPSLPESKGQPGYYVIPGIWYGGCPHELTFCTQVWRESNGQPGLQTGGSNPDHLVLLVCPYP